MRTHCGGIRLSPSAHGVAIRAPRPVVPSRASRGRLLPASSSSVCVPAPRTLNRASESQLRDCTAIVSFDEERTFSRSSASDFHHHSAARHRRLAGKNTKSWRSSSSSGGSRLAIGAGANCGIKFWVRDYTFSRRVRAGICTPKPPSGRSQRLTRAHSPHGARQTLGGSRLLPSKISRTSSTWSSHPSSSSSTPSSSGIPCRW